MSFPRYPAYKPSGVEWLGEVPEHWEVLPLKRRSRLLTEKTDCKDNPIALENIEGWTGRLVETESEFQGEGVAFQAGDILFGKLRPYLAKVYLAESSGQAIGDFHVISPFDMLHPRFLQLQLLTRELIDLVNGSTYGAKMPRASWDFLGSLHLSLPPVDEQHAIATFLDRETAKIDALIAEQQRLMQLLQEKRQAVISHAVTKGLNPDAPMKNSGVEWLGEVPENWEVKKLRFVCKIQTGSRDTEEALEDGEYPFFVRSQTIERINSYSYDCEAVLTAGDGAGVGKVFHYYSGPFDFHQRVYMLNEFNHVHGKLIYHFLKVNFFKVALQGGAKSTVDSLRRPMFTAFPVCIPPEEEQQPLLEYVEAEEKRISKLVSSSEEIILLLQERRSALISAAVTGQIDVRGLAPGADAA